MIYAVSQDTLYVYEWLVTARTAEGEIVYKVAFRGQNAELRAREYADWKNGQQQS